MNFNNSFTINNLVTDANKGFTDLQERLTKIDNRLTGSMHGKTRVGLIFGIIVTVAWGAGIVFLHSLGSTMVNKDLIMISLIASLALVVIMLLDHVMNFKYYGTILQYKSRLAQLKNQLNVGRNNVSVNKDVFLKSRTDGWKHTLAVGNCIPEEAKKIEDSLANVEAFSSGFVNGLKNFLYYAVTIIFMIVGSIALFETTTGMISGIADGVLESKGLRIVCIIGLIIAGIIEIILAKLVWGATNCSVTNATLFMILGGPILFVLVVVLGTLLVVLLIAIIKIVLGLAAIALGAACVCGMVSGG